MACLCSTPLLCISRYQPSELVAWMSTKFRITHAREKSACLAVLCAQVPSLRTMDMERGDDAPPSGESFQSAKQREQHEQSQSGEFDLCVGTLQHLHATRSGRGAHEGSKILQASYCISDGPLCLTAAKYTA